MSASLAAEAARLIPALDAADVAQRADRLEFETERDVPSHSGSPSPASPSRRPHADHVATRLVVRTPQLPRDSDSRRRGPRVTWDIAHAGTCVKTRSPSYQNMSSDLPATLTSSHRPHRRDAARPTGPCAPSRWARGT